MSDTKTNNKDIIEDICNLIMQPLPEGLCVIDKSVPVPFFGNIDTAKAATISINPSYREFEDKEGNILQGDDKRFVDRDYLKLKNKDPLDIKQSKKVFDSYVNYFQKNPFNKWFQPLDRLIKESSNGKYSYYNGSLIGLDICCYATNPKWGELSDSVKNKLLIPKFSVIPTLIEKLNLEYLFVNGTEAKGKVEKYLDVSFTEWSHPDKSITIYEGKCKSCKVVAWNIYWQSRSSPKLKEDLKKYLAL